MNGRSIPAPYVFPPSGSFDGNDGTWSTFAVNVGASDSPYVMGQDFKVLISTSGSVTSIPIQSDWCNRPDDTSCARARGVQLYHGKPSLGYQLSSSWKDNGIYSLDLAKGLKYGTDTLHNAQYGYDTVGLGVYSTVSPMLLSQMVAGTSTQDYFMGIFGLSDVPVKFKDVTVKSFINTFNDSNVTTSLSYGYTAGASYRNNGVLANLVLGGYDKSRFTDGASISMVGGGNSSLIVAVKDITIHPDAAVDSNIISTMGPINDFHAWIDSTLPYLWLPNPVCDAFAKFFGLTYDSTTELYQINDTSHARNKKANASVVITVGSTKARANERVSISLPYDAFEQMAKWPIYPVDTRYFPIKRSPTNKYVLGRTFLQEAYLVVDYERSNFSISRAVFSDPMPGPQIVPIYTKPSVLPSKPAKHTPKSIAGIAVAIACVIGAIAALSCFLYRRRQRAAKEETSEMSATEVPPSEKGHHRRASELEDPASPAPTSLRRSTNGYYSPDDIVGALELESPASEQMELVKADSSFSKYQQQMRQLQGGQGLYAVHELPGDHGFVEIEAPEEGTDKARKVRNELKSGTDDLREKIEDKQEESVEKDQVIDQKKQENQDKGEQGDRETEQVKKDTVETKV